MEGAMANGVDVNDSTGQPTMDSPSVRLFATGGGGCAVRVQQFSWVGARLHVMSYRWLGAAPGLILGTLEVTNV
jgi:hypothetical protein